MRTFKTLVLAAVIAISCTLSAYATETTEVEKAEKTAITKEIGKLLSNTHFEINQDIKALVRIVINQDNQMVVLYVDSNDALVKSYIKHRLNYKTLDNNITDKDIAYLVPVRITQEK